MINQFRNVSVVLSAWLVASCTHTIDQMTITLDEEGRGRFSASGHANMTEQSRNDVIKAGSDLSDKLEACGFYVTSQEGQEAFRLSVSMPFDSTRQLNEHMDCSSIGWDDFVVRRVKENGLFYTSYVTTISMSQPSLDVPFGSAPSLQSLNDFPLEMVVQVPGEVDEIHSQDSIEGLTITAEQDVLKNRVTVHAVRGSPEEAERQALLDRAKAKFDGTPTSAEDVRKFSTDAYELKIESSEPLRLTVLLFGGLIVIGIIVLLGRGGRRR